MKDAFLKSLKLSNFLSFGPGSKAVELTPLNVLIGPNASGKSNFIEAIELLHATPTDLANPVRFGGTAGEWLWKGNSPPQPAVIEAILQKPADSPAQRLVAKMLEDSPALRYRLAFTEARFRLEIVEELLAKTPNSVQRIVGKALPYYYQYESGSAAKLWRKMPTKRRGGAANPRRTAVETRFSTEQSIFAQGKDADLYPEVHWAGSRFQQIQTFREWTFGRTAAVRRPQRADLASDALDPSIVNLGLVLNGLEHTEVWPRYQDCVKRFLPRFSHLSIKVQSGSVQIMMQEEDFAPPIPATRLSDGTLRFLALLALLLKPEPAPLICIEEPELGMHPDALAIIAELLVEASTRTQVVVTTHSDVLVSALSEHAESVLVCEYLKGGTQMQRLESEKLREWLKEYRLGEVWRLGKLGGNLW
jgi:predicted ATPase